MQRLPMRTLIVMIFVLILRGPAAAADITATTHITAVTVYADRATVTRTAEMEIPAGASTIVIDNLPASVLPNSLRAEGVASSSVTLGAVESKTVNGAELVDARERDLNGQLQALQDKRALLDADEKANETRQAFIASLGNQVSAAANQNFTHIDLNPQQWTAATAAIYTGMDESLKAAAALTVALRDIDQQIAAMQQNMNQLRTGQRSSVRVSIPLEASASTTATITLSYQVPQATWRPIYDARLDTGNGKLAITQFGEVRQATGEDWNDVSLTLSTAQPSQGASPPHMYPELVDLGRHRPESLDATEKDFAAAGAPARAASEQMSNALKQAENTPMQFATAIQTSGFTAEYKVPGPATAKADNSEYRVMIGTLDSTATLLDQLRPALTPHAFLMARIKIGGDSPLLPGDANLFRDGVFIGSDTMRLIRPGEEATVAFGIDDQIVVKRESIEDTMGTSGVLSKNRTEERKEVTHIHNLYKKPVTLEMLQTIPVPRDDSITLEMLPEATTADYTSNAENVEGLALWKLKLPADGKADIKLGWRLSWPDQGEIQGVAVGVSGGYDRF